MENNNDSTYREHELQLKKYIMKENEKLTAKSTKARNHTDSVLPECLSYVSPFQGAYKILNRKIIWKLPFNNIMANSLLARKSPSVSVQLKQSNSNILEPLSKPKPIIIINTPISIAPQIALSKTQLKLHIKFAYASKPGTNDTLSGIPKINQDCATGCSEFCRKEDSHFFALADGHGPFGEQVSNLVINSLKSILLNNDS